MEHVTIKSQASPPHSLQSWPPTPALERSNSAIPHSMSPAAP
jgi:hypothetical protein